MTRITALSRISSAMLAAAVTSAAAAGEIRDLGEAGSFFLDTNDNMAIYDSLFEVQFDSYDGNGETDESEKSTASILYNSLLPGLGVPPDELFTSLELQLTTWDGRDEFDEQTLSDIYSAEISDNGVDFSPLELTFTGDFPNSSDGFTTNIATAEGFESQYVKINIQARTESADSGFNDAWSSRLQEVYLITALPGVSGGVAGDYNGSGSVEQGDLDLVLGNWGQARTFDAVGDPFITDSVDQEELDRVLGNWGSSIAPTFNGVAVPEPAAFGIAAGLGLLASRRRPVRSA